MHFITTHKGLSIGIAIFVLLVGLVVWQVLYITMHYRASVPAPAILRGVERFGSSGTLLTFVVMGDSTSIGQGAPYDQAIAQRSAQYLARQHMVSMTNVGISGARVADVRARQLSAAAALKPDVVLLAIGANDVTHLSGLHGLRTDMAFIITQLQAANPHVQIVLTGSPAMGSVPRFAPPTQWIAAARTRQVNEVFAEVVSQTSGVILLPLARETGPIFKRDPSLFAADNFHPNAAGYGVWWGVIESGLASLHTYTD
jgi:lysophospholipase L1-like esterase